MAPLSPGAIQESWTCPTSRPGRAVRSETALGATLSQVEEETVALKPLVEPRTPKARTRKK